MILTEDDILTFAPGANITADSLAGALGFLHSIIEGDAGAGRPLDLSLRTQKGSINPQTQSFYLKHFPIVVSVNQPIVIKIRVGNEVVDGFGRSLPVGDWRELEPDQFVLDVDNRVNLRVNGLYRLGWPLYSHTISGDSYGFTEYEARYYAGFDFTQDTDEINKLKAAAGAILTYLQQSGAFKGVESIQVPFNEMTVKYNTDVKLVGTIPDFMLLPFKALRVRF